ncbi:MAG: GntR family transcriptional regulator [Frankiales bacterium]|nr:GntR family transcriptional regulator [Frankiales bacterium]
MREGGLDIQPARRRGLTDEVAENVRQAIFDGSLQLGERLNEVDIAERLQVSRGPVREALVQLKQEGIVTMEWHRGAFIVQLSADDFRELASLRTILEVFAIRQAAVAATQADLDDLCAVVKSMSSAMADQSDFDMIQLDVQFHDALYRASHHGRLWNAWSSIRSQVLLSLVSRRAVNNNYYRDLVIAEHEELLQVISSRDVEACEKAIRGHLSDTYDRLVGTFDGADPAQESAKR